MSQEPPPRPPDLPGGGAPPPGPSDPPPQPPAVPQPATPAGWGEGERVLERNNRFGTVSNRAVHYRLRKNLFAGTVEEDLPMRHITGVRVETSRHAIWGVILALVGGIMLLAGLSGSAGVTFFGLIILALGAFLIWGWPKVVITSGGEPHGSVSWPWTRTEANRFRNVLNQELLSQQRG